MFGRETFQFLLPCCHRDPERSTWLAGCRGCCNCVLVLFDVVFFLFCFYFLHKATFVLFVSAEGFDKVASVQHG